MKDAYTFAADLHGRFDYKGLAIILEDVVRERGMASKETVRLVFTSEGCVRSADKDFWEGKESGDRAADRLAKYKKHE